MKKIALVLSGGGARGAYQIGVWKALKKLHIKFDIVTGTSVGALNGALIVQNKYRAAKKIWKNISFDKVYGTGFHDEGEIKTIDIYKKYATSFIKDGGVDTSTLDQLFAKQINYKKFIKSNINFGIVTVNISNLKPEQIKKCDMMEETLKDYLLASSACYPAFKIKTINNEKYIDGGYYDNLPINLAIELGATEVIAVDLETVGIKRAVTNKEIKITKISPKNKICNFLIFEKKLSNQAIDFGYNDTMKTFGKLDGNVFTFKKNELTKNYNNLILKYKQNLNELKNLKISKNILLDLLIEFKGLNRFLSEANTNKEMNGVIEYLGAVFELEQSIIYKIKNFNKILSIKSTEIEQLDLNLIEQRIKNNEIKELLNSKIIIKYIFNKINEENKTPKQIRHISEIALVFKKEFLSAIYLKTIK